MGSKSSHLQKPSQPFKPGDSAKRPYR